MLVKGLLINMEIAKYTSWNKQVVNMDRTKQEIGLVVIRHPTMFHMFNAAAELNSR